MCSVDVKHLSPDTRCVLSGPRYTIAMRGMEASHGISRDFSPRLSWLMLLLSALSTDRVHQPWPQIGHYCPGWSAATWWQGGYTATLPSLRGQKIFLIRMTHILGTDALSTHNNSAKTPSVDSECFIHHHGILHNTAADQETHFIAK